MKIRKITTVSMLSVASLALIFLVYGGVVSSATNNSTTNAAEPVSDTTVFEDECSLNAYVIDKDRNGVNVRDSPNTKGELVGVIPLDKEGTTVHIVKGSGDNWVQIDKAKTYAQKIVYNGYGWVSGNLLAISVRGYDGKGVKLYEYEKGGKVLTTIPPETEVKIAGCEGKRAYVKYKGFSGYIESEDQCATTQTLCN